MASQTKELESSNPSLLPSVEEYDQNCGPDPLTRNLKVTFLAPQWGSSKEGISTVNRELAINVAKDPKVDVTIFVVRCNEEDKKAAVSHKIDLVEAIEQPGYDELEWLNFPPDDLQIDVVVGHGVEYGHQAQAIKRSHKCKWVQVVHTAPEELGMYKKCSNSVSVNEKKHETEVKLCEMADFVVTVGPKLSESFRASLRACRKDPTVFEFTPGILAEFSKVKQVVGEGEKFRVLVCGCGDEEEFELKGFDIAAKAVSMLDDSHLTFVVAPKGKQVKVKNRLLKCGMSAKKLIVRSFLERREDLKNLLCEVDLAVMPSRTEGFGLTGLEALSAGLPILVSGNSGFGEALRKVPFGSYFVVDSQDPEVWAKAIKHISGKDGRRRLKETKLLRTFYAEEYSWKSQTKSLIDRMVSMTHGSLSITFALDSVKAKSGDVLQEEDTKQRIMHDMEKNFFERRAAHTPKDDTRLSLDNHLEESLGLTVRGVSEGSLRITVECSTLEILERLWEDYCSGHLSAVAEECLLTDDIKTRFDVESVKLKTTILEEDYLACKLFLMGILQINQDSTLEGKELLPQDLTQSDDETQNHAAKKPEQMTLHLAESERGSLTNTQRENCVQQEGEETTDVEELSQYFHHLKVMRDDSTPRKGSENSFRIAAECHNLESLERLWEDYRSGLLNAIAEKRLLTDDIKTKFHVESANVVTTILEGDYLACKDFFLNKTAEKPLNPTLDIMALKINTTLTCLDLRGKQIDDNGARSLSEVLKVNTTLNNLDVSENNIGRRGANSIFETLKYNATLTNLNVSKNNIGAAGTFSLFLALKHNVTLTVLDLSKNNIGKEAAGPLSSALRRNTPLVNLNVSKNNFGAAGARYFAIALEENATLTNLNMSKNNIDAAGARYLSSALEHNNTLTNLDVSKNNIGEGGAISLFSALEHNATLTNLNVSKNNIGEDGARFLSSTLRHNSALTDLDVSKNNIGVAGAHFLSRALRHNATLTDLDVSKNNADLEARFISEILENRTTSKLNKPKDYELTNVEAGEIKNVRGRFEKSKAKKWKEGSSSGKRPYTSFKDFNTATCVSSTEWPGRLKCCATGKSPLL